MKNSISKQIKNNLYIIDIVLFIYILIMFFFKDSLGSLLNYINVSFFLMITFFAGLTLGIKKFKKTMKQQRVSNIIVISSIIYLIFIYVLGSFISIAHIKVNLVSAISLVVVIFIREILRYLVCMQGAKNSNQLFIVTFLFILFDTLILSDFSLINPLAIEYFVPFIIISVMKNSMLTYITYKHSIRSSMIFALILDVLPNVLPIYPAYSSYINLIVQIVYTTIIYYLISKPYHKDDFEDANSYHQSFGFYFERGLLVFVLFIILLSSGIFKFYLASIGSNSMYPSLQRGDAILIEKLDDKQKDNIKKGDIVVFYEDDEIITHRVIEVEIQDKNMYIITKGDNNDVKDSTKHEKNDIIGIVRLRIPLLGYPSVEISDITNKE